MDVVCSPRVLHLADPEDERVSVEVNGPLVQAEQSNVRLADARLLGRKRAVGPTRAAAVDIVEDEEVIVGITAEVAALEDHRMCVYRRTMRVDAMTCLPDIEAEA
jgi:hypothetical protein